MGVLFHYLEERENRTALVIITSLGFTYKVSLSTDKYPNNVESF